MSAGDRLLVAGARLLPRRALSRTARKVAAARTKMAVRQFAARCDIDLDEAEKPLEDYDSVLELFTRRLKPEARSVDPRPDILVSPVDGVYVNGGRVGDGTLVQAKGRTYTLAALLADPDGAAAWKQGAYCTLYLSPRDYHRVHAPIEGEILGYTYVPGDLFPVNDASARQVDGLYARNERVITHILSAQFGRVDLVKVGATNVGRIRLTYAPTLVTNQGQRQVVRRRYDDPIPLERGEELAVFEIGSTVIVVTELLADFGFLASRLPVRMGVALGHRSAL